MPTLRLPLAMPEIDAGHLPTDAHTHLSLNIAHWKERACAWVNVHPITINDGIITCEIFHGGNHRAILEPMKRLNRLRLEQLRAEAESSIAARAGRFWDLCAAALLAIGRTLQPDCAAEKTLAEI